ncbi:MAG TPA: hypothetical protein VJ887_02965 [Actinomycetota bacterium]|nr:hypothetical protein [Actinomycetota bacterium]
MSVIARFTRDGASKYVWAVMALAAIGGLAFAIMYGSDALERERANAQGRAVRYVEGELTPRLAGSDLDGPITGQSAVSLEAAVERTILADERLTRVRIWSADGPLLFSTDQADTPGSNAGLNDQLLRRVAREGVLTRSGISDTGGEDDPERSLVRTYVPIQAGAIAEIDQTDEGTLAAVRTEWMYYKILAGAMLLLFLVLTGLSLRDPIEPINTGVPFASSSVPAGFSLIDDDRLHAVQEVYRLASERVGRLQQKLEESEEARRRLEARMQQALSKAAGSTGAVSPPAPVAEAPPKPAVVQVPESDVVKTRSEDALTAAPAGPLARASRDQKPPPETSSAPRGPADKQKRVRKPKPQKPAKQEPPKREPMKTRPTAASDPIVVPEPTPVPERRVATMATTPASPASPPTAPTAADPELADAEAHEAALEMFIRLTESDRQHHDATEVDQGAVRAALARTAARKKPGGERLQPHEGPPGEQPGGPPKS